MTAKIWSKACTYIGLGAIALLVGLPLACDDSASDDDDDDDTSSSSSSGSSGSNGQTDCGNCTGTPNVCQAGQYCEDATFCTCTEGCLSNANCANDQVCNTGTGYCENTSSGYNCTDLCVKMLSCDTSGVTQAQCEGVCVGFSEACKQCLDENNCLQHGELCSTPCGLD
jgi:hypothetical protein